MTSLVTVHRPTGVLPTIVRTRITRTVVDVQPGWLLLAAPAAAALSALGVLRRRSAAEAPTDLAEAPQAADASERSSRQRPRIVVVAMTRLRRRPSAGAAPDAPSASPSPLAEPALS